MNKKLMALAVASALGTPAVALAQGASTVQIYGTAYLEYAFADQGSGAAGNLNDVDIFQTPGSNIGFKGEEALGGGLSAWFQCESTAAINGTGRGDWCSRNSAVGFKGGFGNLFFGQWDTPFKRTQGITRGVLNETGIYGTGFLTAGGSSTFSGSASPGVFIRRQSNTVNYDTPDWGGFRAMAAISTNQTATAATTGATAGKPRLWSVGLQYVNGPLAVTGGYEVHKRFGAIVPAAGVNADKDKGWHVGAAYTFPIGGGLKISGVYFDLDYDIGASAGVASGQQEVTHKAWQVAADWKIVGPHGLRGGYTKAKDTSGSTIPALSGGAGVQTTCLGGTTCIGAGAGDNGADMWQIIYYYTFSKRTEVGVGYVRLDNDRLGRYSLGGLATPANGSNQDAFALHVRHTF